MNIVLGGRGGQGILFATEVLAEAAVRKGSECIASEDHGMAQRGGSVVSHLKIGGAQGPLVAPGDADVLLSLEKTETYRNLRFLKKGGACFANVPAGESLDARVLAHLESAGIGCFCIDADGIAKAAGVPQASNAALLGLFSSWPGTPFTRDEFLAAMAAAGSEKTRKANEAVFGKGAEFGKGQFFR
jgi:indolepyruvate ferredoxin oxidoreductase beta subunit